MLIKWSIASRRRRQSISSPSEADNITTIGPQSPSPPIAGNAPARPPLIHHGASSGEISSTLSSSDGPTALFKHATLARSQETEDGAHQRRAQLEERAMYLRNDKLLSAGENPRLVRKHSSEGEQHTAAMRPSHALTMANMESYNVNMQTHDVSDQGHTRSMVDPMREMLEDKVKKRNGSVSTADDVQTERPRLMSKGAKWESQQTITKT